MGTKPHKGLFLNDVFIITDHQNSANLFSGYI